MAQENRKNTLHRELPRSPWTEARDDGETVHIVSAGGAVPRGAAVSRP
jgi:hypothetical protein